MWFSALNSAVPALVYSESVLIFTHGDQIMIIKSEVMKTHEMVVKMVLLEIKM